MAYFKARVGGSSGKKPITIPSLQSGGGQYSSTGSQMSRVDITIDVSDYDNLNIDDIYIYGNAPTYIYINLDDASIYSLTNTTGSHPNLSFDISNGSSLRIRASGYASGVSGTSMPTSVAITNIVIS